MKRSICFIVVVGLVSVDKGFAQSGAGRTKPSPTIQRMIDAADKLLPGPRMRLLNHAVEAAKAGDARHPAGPDTLREGPTRRVKMRSSHIAGAAPARACDCRAALSRAPGCCQNALVQHA